MSQEPRKSLVFETEIESPRWAKCDKICITFSRNTMTVEKGPHSVKCSKRSGREGDNVWTGYSPGNSNSFISMLENDSLYVPDDAAAALESVWEKWVKRVAEDGDAKKAIHEIIHWMNECYRRRPRNPLVSF